MVRTYLIFLMLCAPGFLCALPNVQIDVSASPNANLTANQPIPILITITHPKTDVIDVSSFKVNGKPIQVNLIKDIQISPPQPLMLTMYQWQMAGLPQGLQLIPTISVKVGSDTLQSIPATIQIGNASQANVQATSTPVNPTPAPSTPSSAPSITPELKLEEIVPKDKQVYIGQEITVGYRYLFNVSIDLTKEVVPLLTLNGFRNIGDKQIQSLQEGSISVWQVTQKMEAIKPGTYSYGPSIVEGRAYTMQGNQKVYLQPLLHAEIPVQQMNVLDFPKENKPPSFQGAVGNFTIQDKLVSPVQVYTGDKMTIEVAVKGQGQLDSVTLPMLCCEPGFSGLFKIQDLPPVGKITGDSKTFQVDIWPLNANVKAIPPVIFSFFNPEKKEYETIKSDSIPIEVKDQGHLQKPVQQPMQAKQVNKSVEISYKPAPLEIETNALLSSSDLYNKPFGGFWVFGLIPIFLLAFLMQIQMQKLWKEREKRRNAIKPEDILNQAIQNRNNPSAFFQLLQSAFLLKLKEKGEIQTVDIASEDIPKTAISTPIRDFLCRVDEERFTGKLDKVDDALIEEALRRLKELK